MIDNITVIEYKEKKQELTPFPHPLPGYLAWRPVELYTESFFWNTVLAFTIIYFALIYMKPGSCNKTE